MMFNPADLVNGSAVTSVRGEIGMRVFSLAGTFMYRDIELAEFDIRDGIAVEFKVLHPGPTYFPVEMQRYQNGSTLVNALLARIVPETRHGLLEELASVGIKGYDISAILHYQNASSLHDDFWVRFKDGPQTWRELRRKIGYTT